MGNLIGTNLHRTRKYSIREFGGIENNEQNYGIRGNYWERVISGKAASVLQT